MLHAVAPDTLKRPARHKADAGVEELDPAGHAYPALQFVHDVAPAILKVPAGHIAAAGVDEFDPAGHA